MPKLPLVQETHASSTEEKDKSSMPRIRRTAILLIAVIATAIYFTRPSSPSVLFLGSNRTGCEEGAPKAHTKNGTYCGISSSEYSQDYFLGVPYAKPPVGDLRFRAPQHRDVAFPAVRPATSYSEFCGGYGKDHGSRQASEDCLYLNIVRPALYDGKEGLPVAVWIHGGAFAMGSASAPKYNLSFIVEQGVKVGKPFIGVSINYRLAGWGFLAGNEVMKSGETNLGLRDQRLALHWVQENIKGFGGDPAKVTIWGESAGGASVGFHLIAYGGRDDKLFRAAVMESGGPILYTPIRNLSSYESQYQSLLEQVNCQTESDTLQCLRRVPFQRLDGVFRDWHNQWLPGIDGDLVWSSAHDQLSSEKIVRVPIIAGTNSDEGTSFAPRGLNSDAEFRSFVERQVRPHIVQKIMDAYPDDDCFGVPEDLGCKRLGPPYGGQFRRAAAFQGDLSFIAQRRLTCETWARVGLPAYCYRFNAHAAGIPPEHGAPHFAEVAYVFANIYGAGLDRSNADVSPDVASPLEGRGDEHVHLSKLMSRSWASFFVDLDPNSFRGGEKGLLSEPGIERGVPQWPAYDSSARMQFVFDARHGVPAGGSHVEEDTFREEGIDIIKKYYTET